MEWKETGELRRNCTLFILVRVAEDLECTPETLGVREVYTQDGMRGHYVGHTHPHPGTVYHNQSSYWNKIWGLGGNQRTLRKPMQTRVEREAKHRIDGNPSSESKQGP